MKDFKELNSRVYKWSKDKGIQSKGNPMAQQSKTEEEVGELREALTMQNNNIKNYINSNNKLVNTDNEILDL